MSPLRVCIDARTRHGAAGGIQQFIIGLVRGLSGLDDGGEDYVILGDEETETWLGEFIGGRCRLESAPATEPRSDAVGLKEAVLRSAPGLAARLGDAPFLWKALPPPIPRSNGTIERLGVDLVHFTTQDALLTSVPSIYHPHDLQHLHLPQFFSRRAGYLRERSYRAFCEQARMVAVVSTWTRDDVVTRYRLPVEKVRVIPFAPATAAYAPLTETDAAAFASAVRLPARFVFFPAQTWPHKNHAALLEALAILKTRHGLVLPLVSSGHKNDHCVVLTSLADRLGIGDQVHFVGFVSAAELQWLYGRSVAVVIPSLFEAASFPLWEAFLAGVPTACSNVTSLPAQAAGAALLFNPTDPSAIADAVLRLWSNPALCAELVSRGRENVARFSWDRTAQHFRAHYRRLTGRPLDAGDIELLAAAPLL